MPAQDALRTRATVQQRHRRSSRNSFVLNVKALLVEFGLAEAFDYLRICPVLVDAVPR